MLFRCDILPIRVVRRLLPHVLCTLCLSCRSYHSPLVRVLLLRGLRCQCHVERMQPSKHATHFCVYCRHLISSAPRTVLGLLGGLASQRLCLCRWVAMAAIGVGSAGEGRPQYLPLRVAGLWGELSENMRTSISRMNIPYASVFFRGLFDGSEEDALEFVGETGGGPQDVAVLMSLWVDLESSEDREMRRIASTSNPAMMVALGKADRKRTHTTAHGSGVGTMLGSVDGFASAPTAWPTKIKRCRTLENSPWAREIAEAWLRQKWVAELREIVIRAGLPVVHIAMQMKRPETILSSVGRGRRAKTIRRRVLYWRKAARCFRLACGKSWPTDLEQILDYIDSLVEGGAARSTLDRFAHAK